jgi:hypothetical protein
MRCEKPDACHNAESIRHIRITGRKGSAWLGLGRRGWAGGVALTMRRGASARLTAWRARESAVGQGNAQYVLARRGMTRRGAAKRGANGATARRAVKQGKEGHVLARHGGQSAGAMRRERGHGKTRAVRQGASKTRREGTCGKCGTARRDAARTGYGNARGTAWQRAIRPGTVWRGGAQQNAARTGYGNARAVGWATAREILARTGA